MELEGIMLSEKSQRKTNNVWSHLYMESKKQNKTKTNSEREIRDRRWGEGEMEEGGQKIATFCYKINKYPEGNVQHDD